jgi:hypothetical protein
MKNRRAASKMARSYLQATAVSNVMAIKQKGHQWVALALAQNQFRFLRL